MKGGLYMKLYELMEKYPNTIGTIFGFIMFLYWAGRGHIVLSLIAAGLVILCGHGAQKELK